MSQKYGLFNPQHKNVVVAHIRKNLQLLEPSISRSADSTARFMKKKFLSALMEILLFERFLLTYFFIVNVVQSTQ